MKKNTITLFVAIVIIVTAIWFLQSKKVKNSGTTDAVTIIPRDQTTTASDDTPLMTDTKGEGTTGSAVDISPTSSTTASFTKLTTAQKAAKYTLAKEITTPDGFINTNNQPVKIQDYIGKKVVLIDFWTYSCINCQRTTPYLNGWYTKYEDKGLVIIGIHTPEFDFEKNYDNVKAAVGREGIRYPVVLDNDYSTWNAYENRFWPRKYLIDIDGYVVYDHIGEGGYTETEREIQKALAERQSVLGLHQTIDTSVYNPSDAVALDASKVQSPETYFGALRNEHLGNGKAGAIATQTFTLPVTIAANTLYLDGSWDIQAESAKSTTAQSKIVYTYNAKDIYLVASSDTGVKVTIKEDGKVVTTDRGADVSADGTLVIKENRLYKLIQSKDYGVHTIEITIETPGLTAFAFTFG